jgi:hypothetical protein
MHRAALQDLPVEKKKWGRHSEFGSREAVSMSTSAGRKEEEEVARGDRQGPENRCVIATIAAASLPTAWQRPGSCCRRTPSGAVGGGRRLPSDHQHAGWHGSGL